jgi:hypothetical protein
VHRWNERALTCPVSLENRHVRRIRSDRSTRDYQAADAAHHHAFVDQKALNEEGPRG